MTKVSIITPTYNRGDILPRAIDSVLNQSFENFEYIVVDDASTDRTQAIVEEYEDDRIRYLRHEANRRQAAARNTGIEAANGEYVAFIDSDDEWLPKKLARQMDEISQRDNDWIGIYCDSTTQRTSRLKEVITKLFPYEVREEGREELMRDILAMQGNISAGSSLVVRTNVAREIGGFDETLPRHEDIDFVLRLLQEGNLAYLDEELVIVHESPDPTAEQIKNSKEILLDKFEEEITQIEEKGYPVRRYHQFHLARCYFQDGEFLEGIRHLSGSKASNPRQYIRLLVSLPQGLRQKYPLKR
ncbi:glycosyltransferase family 2 protein [Halobacterium sp. CBA1126]|uniref:glycosyltransferase family 2 protein n=1 Tax=Halobacterium sp. CBA1126 TaxID=2668074 RepID=UPI0012F95FCA|nr:glycosyltransferase family 2 protein [Halobacterium sp. CBA1126]MUV59832.1 glycosyltransferase [Halobacterium sp. CBA1126]